MFKCIFLVLLTVTLMFTQANQSFASSIRLHCQKNGHIEDRYRIEDDKLFYIFDAVEREAEVYQWNDENIIFYDRNVYLDTLLKPLVDFPVGNETIKCSCAAKKGTLKTAKKIDRVTLEQHIVALDHVLGVPIYDYLSDYRENNVDRVIGENEMEVGNQICSSLYDGSCFIFKNDQINGMLYSYNNVCKIVAKSF